MLDFTDRFRPLAALALVVTVAARCSGGKSADSSATEAAAQSSPAAAAGDVMVAAMKNGVFCMVDSTMRERASLEGAEKYAGAAIPDALAAPLARKLAMLCDDIWQ